MVRLCFSNSDWDECRTPFWLFKMDILACGHFFSLSCLSVKSQRNRVVPQVQANRPSIARALTQQIADVPSSSTQSFIKAVFSVPGYLHMVKSYQRGVKWQACSGSQLKKVSGPGDPVPTDYCHWGACLRYPHQTEELCCFWLPPCLTGHQFIAGYAEDSHQHKLKGSGQPQLFCHYSFSGETRLLRQQSTGCRGTCPIQPETLVVRYCWLNILCAKDSQGQIRGRWHLS